MTKKRLIWQLFPVYVLVTLLSLAAVTVYTARSVSSFHMANVRANLEVRARLVADDIREAIGDRAEHAIQTMVTDLGNKSATRVTVILPSGVVVGDSEESPKNMDNHGNRPEVVEAMSGEIGHAVRFSHTTQRDFVYVAIPVDDGESLVAVLRCSLPLAGIQALLWSNRTDMALGAAVVGVLGIFASWIVARRITRPLEQLRLGAESFSRGDLAHRIHATGSEEIAALGHAMNQMALELEERIRNITEQRNEQEAVLSSMLEGVLAVDTDGCIISMNRSASQMLKVDLLEGRGKSMESVVRNTVFQQFIERVLKSDVPIEEESALHVQREQIVQLHGTALRDADGNSVGAVVVLNDVTQLRRLEQVRTDFVANASHELRTPITSIKGYAETLRDGALAEPERAQGFVEVIVKQADRLTAILEDILALSRIEAGKTREELRLEKVKLSEVMETVLTFCNAKAEEKNIELIVDCPDSLEVRANSQLIEQGVTNLVDNAIKYSSAHEKVRIEAEQVGEEVVIRVRDNGVGISPEHVPRLFERFYRVDKARSRNLGSTGLGLAIVRHIAAAHQGEVRVESAPGRGSTFSIHLPC